MSAEEEEIVLASHVYLAKAGSDLVCHCKCDQALMTFPAQLDCPWCGCGWLFSCIECRKAFTFARGVAVKQSWEELARRDMTNYGRRSVSQEDIDGWVRAMKELLVDVEVGTTYVYLDRAIIAADAGAVRLQGWHSRHDLPFVPQVAALEDSSVLTGLLFSPKYWRANAHVWRTGTKKCAACAWPYKNG
jgi:hypothetical protein